MVRTWVYSCIFGILLAGFAHDANAGFGITPPYVRNDRLTQGSEFTQEIILVRGDPVDDLKAEITINVPGIEDWITIDKGTEFLLPTGEAQVPMRVTVRVPQDAAFDRYTGNIRIRTVSPDLSSGVSIALGAQIDVDLRVVDKILDFDVKRVQLAETEEPRRRWWLDFPGKISFTVTISNTGNAPVAPDRIAFDIYDKRGTVLLEHTEHTNALEKVTPFETKPVTAELPSHLPPGAYLVKYSIYLEDTLKREGELTLSVLPEGTLENYKGYGFWGLSLGDKLSLIIPPIVLLVGIAAAIVLSRLMNKRPRPPKSRARPTRDRADGTPGGSTPSSSRPRAPQPASSPPRSVVDLSRRRTER